jgi:hypothetical protein
VYQSPTNPGQLRGITNFTRLVKALNLPGNVSSFVGSPVTGSTRRDTTKEFIFDGAGTNEGIYGFTADSTILFDIISHQFFDIPSCLVLRPNGLLDSGEGASNFFSITMEMWNFPRVLPLTFTVGNPINPFNVPGRYVIINPSSQVQAGGGQQAYYQLYRANYKTVNSPRYRTQLSYIYRGSMPEPGDTITLTGGSVDTNHCGRISNVGLNLSRSGVTVNATCEVYHSQSGLADT